MARKRVAKTTPQDAAKTGRGRRGAAKTGKPLATRARTRDDADRGIRRIVELMTSGGWVSGRSHVEMAAELGVSPATVKDYATAASRLIRLAVEQDPGEIRARILSSLEHATHLAFSKRAATSEGDLYDSPDVRSAVSALEVQARILGLITHRHEVKDVNVTHLSREEHLAELARLKTEIEAEEQRLAAEGRPPSIGEGGLSGA